MAVPRIFVSHSHHDNAFCRDYVNGLREHGLDVWYDEYSLGWGALRSTIEREMPLCQHFVAILSPAAIASRAGCGRSTDVNTASDHHSAYIFLVPSKVARSYCRYMRHSPAPNAA